MRRILNFTIIFSTVMFAFSSCKKEKNEEIKLSVDFQTELFGKEGGEFYFDIKSNSEWTITKPVEITWIASITPERDNGDQKITVVIEKNETYLQRSASLTVTAGTQTKTVTINQEAEEDPADSDFAESLVGQWAVTETMHTVNEYGKLVTIYNEYITTIAKVDDNTISITNFNGDMAGGQSGQIGNFIITAGVSAETRTITLASQEFTPAWYDGCKTYLAAYLNDDPKTSAGKDLKPSVVKKNDKGKLTFQFYAGETDQAFIEIFGEPSYYIYDVLLTTGKYYMWWCLCADTIYTKLDSSSAPATSTTNDNNCVPAYRSTLSHLR